MSRRLSTDERYARCLANGGHRYGEERITRDYLGFPVELRVCRSCRVPEKPRLRARSLSLPAQRGHLAEFGA